MTVRFFILPLLPMNILEWKKRGEYSVLGRKKRCLVHKCMKNLSRSPIIEKIFEMCFYNLQILVSYLAQRNGFFSIHRCFVFWQISGDSTLNVDLRLKIDVFTLWSFERYVTVSKGVRAALWKSLTQFNEKCVSSFAFLSSVLASWTNWVI